MENEKRDVNNVEDYTKSGYRKKPFWKIIFKAISNSIKYNTSDMCYKSFKLCGILDQNLNFESSNLNEKVSRILYENLGWF